MANPIPITAYTGSTEPVELDRCAPLEGRIQDAPAAGADEIPDAAVSVAIDDADDDCDPPETYDEYGNWKDDYADAVGISRWREL